MPEKSQRLFYLHVIVGVFIRRYKASISEGYHGNKHVDGMMMQTIVLYVRGLIIGRVNLLVTHFLPLKYIVLFRFTFFQTIIQFLNWTWYQKSWMLLSWHHMIIHFPLSLSCFGQILLDWGGVEEEMMEQKVMGAVGGVGWELKWFLSLTTSQLVEFQQQGPWLPVTLV